jgi:parallel beta-helix repeat protein
LIRSRLLLIGAMLALLLHSAPAGAADARGEQRSGAPAARASTELCGSVVRVKTLTLTEDVGPCYDLGLKVERAKGLTINLNGHRIFRDRSNAPGYKTIGIHVHQSSGVRIVGPGQVDGFSDNVRAQASTRVRITGVTARDSGDDNIQLINTRASVIRDSEAHNSKEAGFSIMAEMIDGKVPGKAAGNTIRNSVATDAGHALFQVAIQWSVNRNNRVVGNRGAGSADAGVQVWGSSGNVIADNEIDGVAGSGIHLRNGSYRNRIAGNTVTGSGIGIRLQAKGEGDDEWGTEDNLIRGNTATGNGTDLQEGAADCVNAWRDNTYGSKNRDCID